MSDNVEALVVVSKLKKFIREASGGMSTSNAVVDVLSKKIQNLCEGAIEQAKTDGRKTVMDRDFH